MRTKAFIILFVILWVRAHGQKGVELGGWLGGSQYFGDLQTELRIINVMPAGGIAFRYNFDNRIAVKSSVNYFQLKADDVHSPNSYERNRNLRFSSSNIDWTNQFEFNFLPFVHGSKEEFFTPYLLAGFSIFSYNPQAMLDNQRVNLRDFGTEGQALGEEYGRFSWALTYGIGLKWSLNYDWSINVQLSIHNSRTDYLEDVSNVYPDLGLLREIRGVTAVTLSNPALVEGIGDPGRQRGNNKNNDTYVIFGIGVMKYFGDLECPKFMKKSKSTSTKPSKARPKR